MDHLALGSDLEGVGGQGVAEGARGRGAAVGLGLPGSTRSQCAQPVCGVEATSADGGGRQRQRTRLASHLPRDYPGLPLCLMQEEKDGQSWQPRGGQDAWARMIKTQVSDNGMARGHVTTRCLLLSQHCHL